VGRGDLARGGGWDGSSHEIRHFREADGLSIVREPRGEDGEDVFYRVGWNRVW
jgi:hypothetical protein